MNTEGTKKQSTTHHSIGSCLRLAREQIGLTQQNVAERLCLKVSIVRDIEEDKFTIGLASTFIRGYIRSYARLVHVSEDDLLPIITTQKNFSKIKIKKNKKNNYFLIIFICFIIIFIIVFIIFLMI
ncbi:helix-turn-helix domain-containing protein [Pantoea sp. Aalb]|uniref:helix-turn-helix domain-containing protein n=1 Tax=Pantoea sp. Aalb TaxID=2576762 RepID=UPI001321AE67|nr:helix-turn-helix domain-containing protein [Pantoea sp. Aalb]MXP67257.1 helix-turn-helix domain-containing protein [Pantoea sp. Aalb]